jgi:hypothetical protein
LEHAPRDPDNALVLANLDLELHRLPLGIPAGAVSAFLGKWKSRQLAFGLGGWGCVERRPLTNTRCANYYFRSTHGRVNLISGTTQVRSPEVRKRRKLKCGAELSV